MFVAPPIIIIGVFLVVPILLALWVSFSDWGGFGSPLNPDVGLVGTKNYEAVLTDPGLAQKDFGTPSATTCTTSWRSCRCRPPSPCSSPCR